MAAQQARVAILCGKNPGKNVLDTGVACGKEVGATGPEVRGCPEIQVAGRAVWYPAAGLAPLDVAPTAGGLCRDPLPCPQQICRRLRRGSSLTTVCWFIERRKEQRFQALRNSSEKQSYDVLRNHREAGKRSQVETK